MRKFLLFIGMLALLFAIALYNQARGKLEVKREYLYENRPDVIAAIEAYDKANGHYPKSLTNAIPRYYHGDQERIFFLKSYAYQNLGTNYRLKRIVE
jgi:hypothetical protein